MLRENRMVVLPASEGRSEARHLATRESEVWENIMCQRSKAHDVFSHFPFYRRTYPISTEPRGQDGFFE